MGMIQVLILCIVALRIILLQTPNTRRRNLSTQLISSIHVLPFGYVLLNYLGERWAALSCNEWSLLVGEDRKPCQSDNCEL